MADSMTGILHKLAEGHDIPAVFGSERTWHIERLVSTLRAIKPTEGELIEHGFNGWNARKIAAYRNGVAHLKSAYNTVSPELPEL